MRLTTTITPIGDRLDAYHVGATLEHYRQHGKTRLISAILAGLTPTPIGDRLDIYTVRPPSVPDVVDVVRSYVLDSTSDIRTLPPAPAATDYFAAELTKLARSIPSHKWGKLDRMRDVTRHYNLDITVDKPSAIYKPEDHQP